MDGGFEDLELREAQREYLDFLDDDVSTAEIFVPNLFDFNQN